MLTQGACKTLRSTSWGPGNSKIGEKGQTLNSVQPNPTPYTVVSKHGNSSKRRQYYRNTALDKKLLQHNETPSMQEERVSETSQKEEEPIQQQSVSQEANGANPKFQRKDIQLQNLRFHSGDHTGKAWHQVFSRITIPGSERH